MACQSKHTKYEPTEAEFRCPSCGAEAGVFYVSEPADGTSEDCERLHVDDYLGCSECRFGVSAKAFAAKIQKARNLVTCTHCKGTGLVKEKK